MPKVTQLVGAQSWVPPRMGQAPWASGQRHFGTVMETVKQTKAQGDRVAHLNYRAGKRRRWRERWVAPKHRSTEPPDEDTQPGLGGQDTARG